MVLFAGMSILPGAGLRQPGADDTGVGAGRGGSVGGGSVGGGCVGGGCVGGGSVGGGCVGGGFVRRGRGGSGV